MVGALALQPSLTARGVFGTATNSTKNATTALHANSYGLRYHAQVIIGDQALPVVVDTGNSDLFAIEKGFTCVNNDLVEVPRSDCGYNNLTYSVSKTYREIHGEVFEATYAAGAAHGPMAFEDITLPGVTMASQKFGLVNWSTPLGTGSSGVLGLAFPSGTKAYKLNTKLQDNSKPQGELQTYNPLFVSMYKAGLVEPYFSLALNRLPLNQSEGDGGYLTIGGLPPVDLVSNFTTVPLEYFDGAIILSEAGLEYSYWALTVQNIEYGDHGHLRTPYQAIVDSGSPYLRLPKHTADDYNKGFSTTAEWDEQQGLYEVQCDAVPPRFSITIGNHNFTHNPADLIFRSDEGQCFSAITRTPAETGLSLNIIGVPFLKNVVAVFDIGGQQMHFAQRSGSGDERNNSRASHLCVIGNKRLAAFIAAVWLLQMFK